jgi:hypothetical protein
MSMHRYPPQSLMGDYMRAGAGLILTVAMLMFLDPGTAGVITLLIVGGVCLFFVLRTVDRNRLVVSLDDDAISLTGFRTAKLAWADLARMTLAYYTVKRDKSDGWMELTLKDAKATIKVDSRLHGFGAIVVKAARVARERRIPLNQITLSNLKALNITGE